MYPFLFFINLHNRKIKTVTLKTLIMTGTKSYMFNSILSYIIGQ